MYSDYLKKNKCIMRCMKDGQLGYKYDSRGTCYIGKDAYKKAEKDQKEEKDKTS